MMNGSRGFTLIEIAIVLVIIGLLLGGVLKGQELITGARVRNLISQQDGIKAAFFGFQDRYRALPGDYASASTNIKCIGATCLNGNGNGQIEAAATPVSGSEVHEELLVWTHLTAAGFLNGSYNMVAGATAPIDANNPKNPYSVYLQLVYDGFYGVGTAGSGAGAQPQKHNLKTGSQIPVEILAEVDRKVDDGQPTSGGFQFSGAAIGGATAPVGSGGCYSTASPPTWLVIGTTSTNCGAASLF
jgi:prepilin-type N-terminal cleavage/methylation domain-containing protein